MNTLVKLKAKIKCTDLHHEEQPAVNMDSSVDAHICSPASGISGWSSHVSFCHMRILKILSKISPEILHES